MDALFVVPALISPNINQKLVPAICKVIERNIIITNAASFRIAAIKKYTGVFKTVTSEGYNLVNEDRMGNSSHSRIKTDSRVMDFYQNINNAADRRAASLDDKITSSSKKSTPSIDAIELPNEVVFFSNISLEPTYLIVPVGVKNSILGSGRSNRSVNIGVKCVPYKLEGVRRIISLMQNLKNMGWLEAAFFRAFNNIKTKIPFTKWWFISKGERGKTSNAFGGAEKHDIVDDIIFSPSSKKMANPNALKKMMSNRGNSSWTTMLVLSSYDFEGNELQDLLDDYNRMLRAGFGDIVVVNETTDNIYFCTSKLAACYQISMGYLKQVLNISNVIDYSEIKNWTSKPFNKVVGVRNVFRESVDMSGTPVSNNDITYFDSGGVWYDS